MTSETRFCAPSSSCVTSASTSISTGRFFSQNGCTPDPYLSSPPARWRYASCRPPFFGHFSSRVAASPSSATCTASFFPSTTLGPSSPPQASPSHTYLSPLGWIDGGITVCPLALSSTHIEPSGILYGRDPGTSSTWYQRCERGRPSRPVSIVEGGRK